MKDNGMLAGLRVLVVEDDAMLAMALEMTLSDLGCEVVGLASNLTDAAPLAREATIDGAILDVNLSGEQVFPVADILAARNIPFVFATGYGVAGLRDCDRGRPVLQKPYELGTLVTIARKWRRGAAG
ncbi:MAG: response regulator [Rhodospirillaceae bacterium]|nr:response regulator [Rhodospirillales bacterium]